MKIFSYILFSLILTLSAYTLAAESNQTCNGALQTTPIANFQDNLNGTITDLKTKLTWKKCTEGQIWFNNNTCKYETDTTPMFTWREALELANRINSSGGFAGVTNWRIPNIKELSSIIENTCYAPAINITIFPSSLAGIYWSSTPYIDANDYAWTVSFTYGENRMSYKHDYYLVRLVHDPNS
ncbi:DUF1566 domain-containing protein [uncultured Thiothrix sp.]|jgi:hypothetical protein|uniref:Lcl C-terminal domain-containing protein n=1 Tax=uncultured Thiothrix sp. TaxID=223185 RepID=UPI00261ABD6B|nr:DUF1566 domain-containing protein [uncultured Thiothrix sp.]HMT92590.1 DUF1566 domain-containing protein [Thiolinea sp.]